MPRHLNMMVDVFSSAMLAPFIEDRAPVGVLGLELLAINLTELLSRFWPVDSNGLFSDRISACIELLSTRVRVSDLAVGVESIGPRLGIRRCVCAFYALGARNGQSAYHGNGEKS